MCSSHVTPLIFYFIKVLYHLQVFYNCTILSLPIQKYFQGFLQGETLFIFCLQQLVMTGQERPFLKSVTHHFFNFRNVRCSDAIFLWLGESYIIDPDHKLNTRAKAVHCLHFNYFSLASWDILIGSKTDPLNRYAHCILELLGVF